MVKLPSIFSIVLFLTAGYCDTYLVSVHHTTLVPRSIQKPPNMQQGQLNIGHKSNFMLLHCFLHIHDSIVVIKLVNKSDCSYMMLCSELVALGGWAINPRGPSCDMRKCLKVT